MSIDKEDLIHLEQNLKEHIDLKMLALPCQNHKEQLENLRPRVRDLESWRTRIVAVSSAGWVAVVTYLGWKR